MGGNTFFIYNKEYYHAKLAQWGTGGRDVGTYEQWVNPDQLWYLEESSRYPGYYYIRNAEYVRYRLAKWGEGDSQVGVYNGQYHNDQLWRFQQEGSYYRIYNKEYPSAKIAKWGKADGAWGTYDGNNYDDQLWKLVPRYKAKAGKNILWSYNNLQGSRDETKTVEVTTGIKMIYSQSFTTRFKVQESLTASLSVGIEGVSFGTELQTTISNELESTVSSSTEIFEIKKVTRPFVVPPGKWYQFVQTFVDFTSDLDSDNVRLYCHEYTEELF